MQSESKCWNSGYNYYWLVPLQFLCPVSMLHSECPVWTIPEVFRATVFTARAAEIAPIHERVVTPPFAQGRFPWPSRFVIIRDCWQPLAPKLLSHLSLRPHLMHHGAGHALVSHGFKRHSVPQPSTGAAEQKQLACARRLAYAGHAGFAPNISTSVSLALLVLIEYVTIAVRLLTIVSTIL